jgi:hypothetical protein
MGIRVEINYRGLLSAPLVFFSFFVFFFPLRLTRAVAVIERFI